MSEEGEASEGPCDGASSTFHASALIVGEAGVLIRGASGSGKSRLTLALLALAERRGRFSALIGDDRVTLRAAGGRIVAHGAPHLRGVVERRGHGLVSVAAEPCAVIRLVVDLSAKGERTVRMPSAEALRARVVGVELPRLLFDETSGATEQACAVLASVDQSGGAILAEIAHFA